MPNIPKATHLTNTGLMEIGFVFFDKVYKEKGQGWKMVYKRGEDEVSYDGVRFVYNDPRARAEHR